MARDWQRVALAAFAAVALASLSAPGLDAQAAKRPTKEKAQPAQGKDDDDDGDAKGAAAKKKQDPVEAQRTIEAAAKALQAGKADQAVQALTSTLNRGNLPAPIMAKALYTRGLAFRQKNQPAQAISDLTSALWLKGGLTDGDRADALKQRSAAYADAGLTEAGEPAATVAAAPASAPAKSWSTETTAPAPSSGGGGSWFENLFGASAAPAKAQATPQETASIGKPEPPSAPATRPRIAKAWSSATEVHASRAASAPAAAAPASAPPAQAARPAGKYRVQLGAVRSQAEAQSLAGKVQREHAAMLASREPEIDRAVFGNMGTFYRVRFGPYATLQETQQVCSKLRGSGLDCMSVTQE